MYAAHHSLVPPADWRWRYFTPAELASRGDGSLCVDEDALDRLAALREEVARPLIILSAYRDPLHNARVGGVPGSFHLQGRAFDIWLQGHNKHHLYHAAQRVGFTGFGFYRTFLHVDTGPERSWGRWAS